MALMVDVSDSYGIERRFESGYCNSYLSAVMANFGFQAGSGVVAKSNDQYEFEHNNNREL